MSQVGSGREQRRKFLLRLICAQFAHFFLDKPDSFSRVIVDGVDNFLTKLFWGVHDDLNRGVKFILDDLKEHGDKNLWNEIFNDRYRYHIAVTILIRTLLYFENFKSSKRSFIGRVNSMIKEEKFLFNSERFNLFFLAMYTDVFNRLDDKIWAYEIDVLLGDGSAQKVENIHREFSKSLKPTGELLSEAVPPRKPRRTKERSPRIEETKRILAVDDDKEVRDLLSEVLYAEGYQVTTAGMMEEAEEHLDQARPDLVIIDIFMPGKGGIRGIETIRQNHPELAIMAISGGWGDTTAAQSVGAAKKLGADATLQKPFDLDELVREVRNLIGTV